MAKKSEMKVNIAKAIIAVIVALITVLACVNPMADLPLWNGEIPGHRNQYELMAEAILDGRIEFAYGDEAELEKLDNPYDPDERKEAGVWYHWDHAYYKGHYYMYFGIVPVLITFLPYRVITGTSLTTFHATQIYTAVIIAGMFCLLWLLCQLFFKKLPFVVYLMLSVAFSVTSVWYATAEPALYCTAITAAIALEIWSIFFFVWAVYREKNENKQILLAGIGALLGALVFGCRPPIALANIVVIPMLAVFLRQRKFTKQLAGKLALAALPYLVVGICLMVYNYARFENPFEFGQAYQLTVADQTSYSFSLKPKELIRICSETIGNFFSFSSMSDKFPYFQTCSVFFNFPILFLTLALIPSVRESAKQANIWPVFLGLLISAAVITAADVMWSPFILERYRMDIYFLMGIGCFIALGLWYEKSPKKKLLSTLFIVFSVATVISAFLLCVRTIGVYYPDTLKEIGASLGAL